MTEVRDNREGQKNSPKGKNEQQGAVVAGDKKGALEHGHGRNSQTTDGAREDSRGESAGKG